MYPLLPFFVLTKKKNFLKETVLDSPYFDITVLGIILLNTATLMSDRWPMSHDETFVLDIINFFLTSLFTVEMALKLIGLGTYAYVTDLVTQHIYIYMTFSTHIIQRTSRNIFCINVCSSQIDICRCNPILYCTCI
jgi:hypothetical protein